MSYSTLFKDAFPVKLGSNIYYNLFPFSLERLKKSIWLQSLLC